MKTTRLVVCPALAILALWLQTVTASAVIFTSNTAISFNNTNYDGQDIVVIGCTVTVDGAHTFSDVLLLDGGILTHSFVTNGLISNPFAVTNELQTLTGTNRSILDNTNVDVSTIVVTDTNLITTYVAGTDYVISSNYPNQYQIEIARTPASTISDGATVYVSYTWLGTPVNAGLNLTVSNNVVVEAGSAIDVVGVGLGGIMAFNTGGKVGGGGGSYGGWGAISPGVAEASGGPYGNIMTPTNLGRGGTAAFLPAASGGGAVKLVVGGAIWVDGQIVADGAEVLNGSGGGAGGSIWLTSATFGGAGTISANGGAGDPFDGGGGGGGRIAVYYVSSKFTGNISAHGGTGVQAGGAGTIYTRLTGNPAGQLLVDNAGLQGGANPTQVFGYAEPFDLTITGDAVVWSLGAATNVNLFIGSNSWITVHPFGPLVASLTLSVIGNATIQAGGGIMLVGGGSGGGPGGPGVTRTNNNFQYGTGGGYGGLGGLTTGLDNPVNTPSGLTYGSYSNPTNTGSSGGGTGGSGGGLLLLNVAGTLALDGLITANGNAGRGSGGGGGSGGGIVLTVGTLTGTGNITANGGAGVLPYAGGGGGGRIAINYGTNTFTGGIFALGGQGAQAGGAGTIYTQAKTGSPASLVIDNGGQNGAGTTVYPGTGPVFDLTISGGAVGFIHSTNFGVIPPITFHNLVIASNSSVTFPSGSPPAKLQLSVTGDAMIQSGGSILGDRLGYRTQFGPGTPGSIGGFENIVSGGGGGYGGLGGADASGAAGGVGYGSFTGPTDAGSGGGLVRQALLQSASDGAGGGAIKLTVTGTLTLNGLISANGADAFSQGCGGGAGGGVWLTAGAFSGTGMISANGGAGDFPNGGGGGGGRVAIIYGTNQFTGAISVLGGQGFVNGGAGTVYTTPNGIGAVGTVLVDGGGSGGANSSLGQFPLSDLTITGGATVLGNIASSIRNMLIGSNSSFIVTGQVQDPAMLTFTGNVTVQSGGSINADGLGFIANSGTGKGAFVTSTSIGGTGSGGSYGGNGGAGASGASTNGAYGNLLEPQSAGSGGGTGSGTNSGAAGGGGIRMTVNGTLTLNGTLSANGTIPNFPAGGGGSGGSIWLTTGAITGTGLISANGASGDLPYGGGGGGGRIAIFNGTNGFTGHVIAQGGPGFVNGGAGTVCISPDAGEKVIIDNGGLVGTNTPLIGITEFDNLIITGGAVATPPTAGQFSVHTLMIDTGGVLTESSPGQGNVSLAADESVIIGPRGSIVVDGDGFSGGAGSGAGSMTNLNSGGSGGGYGGVGGAGASGIPGGPTYGSMQQPTNLGSPGGVLPVVPNLSAGGGTIRLTAGVMLTVNGRISANGRAGMFDYGGGSGGSIWLSAHEIFTGNGVISANGGAGEPFAGGGGGGGRIEIDFGASSFTGTTTISGGVGANNGQDGTIYLTGPPVFISGTVTNMNGVPLWGISLQSADGSASTSTYSDGFYYMEVPWGWSGTVVPHLPGGSSTPGQYSYNNLTNNLGNQNFVAVPPPIALSSTFTGTGLNLGWFGTNGVNYQVLSSSNLVDWIPYGSPITGTNAMISLPIPTTGASQMFFRLGTQ